MLQFQSWKWLCKPLHIRYLTRNEKKDAWGKLLEFKDADENLKEFVMLDEMLAGDGVELRKEIMSRGLNIDLERYSKERLAQYINVCTPTQRAVTFEKIGWVNKDIYLLPDRIYGNSEERYLFRPRFGHAPEYKLAGTLEGWKEQIGIPSFGNTRLMFGIITAASSPFLSIMDMSNVGSHVHGMSSVGKTTILQVANSVIGSRVNQWRMTDNAAETFALESNDSVLFLDELNQADARAVDRMIYMLANASTKARANQHGIHRDPCQSFRSIFMSSGEITIDAKLQEIKKNSTAGQGVRCIEITADAGCGYGIYNTLNGFESSHHLTNHLKAACLHHQGVVMDELLKKIVDIGWDKIRNMLLPLMKRWESLNLAVFEMQPDGQVRRVAGHLSLIAAVGELCISLNILPWEKGSALKVCSEILKDWIDTRGGVESKELQDVVKRLRVLVSQDSGSRFDISDDNMDVDNQKLTKMAGVKHYITDVDGNKKWIFCIFQEVFDAEVLKGTDKKVACSYLADQNILIKDEKGKYIRQKRVRGLGSPRLYWVDIDSLEM